MRAALLVAWREYAENAKTKGFWIGLFLFPVIIFGSLSVPIFLEKKATPERCFVLVDQSGQFEKAIETALGRLEQRRLLQALVEYAGKHRQPAVAPTGAAATNRQPAKEAEGRKTLDTVLQAFAEANPQALDQFISQGGEPFLLREIGPFLRPDAPPFEAPKLRYRRVSLPAGIKPDADIGAMGQALKPYLRGAKKLVSGATSVGLHAAILIPADVEKKIVRPGTGAAAVRAEEGIVYWSGNLGDMSLRDEVERAVNNEVRQREFAARGLDVAAIRQVQRTYAPFASLNPKKEAGKEEVNMADMIRQWAPSGFVYLLWIAIFSVSQMLLNNTIEEKSNRVVEVLLSSVTPGELMTGKLAGIAAVGLTMLGVWMLALVGVLVWKSGPEFEFGRQLFSVVRSSNLLPAFFFYFLFGYLLYAAVFLAIGSVCNTLKEAQNFMGVIMIFMMIPLFTMMFIPKDPNGTLATVLSWIPIYTPFVMMNRATADPPLFDVIGTMVLMVASTALAIWLAGRIFRIGILRTGQPPRLLELIRWLKG